ncbi:MAG: hypothetical protein ACXWV4_13610 [Flavitalea sp.]
MKTIWTILILLIFAGCESASDEINQTLEDSIIVSENDDHGITDGAILITREQLTGTWTDGKTPSPTFDIGADSMYYYDAMETYPYQLTGDTIKIFFAEETLNGKVWLQDDTLIISDPAFSTTKYYRVKR